MQVKQDIGTRFPITIQRYGKFIVVRDDLLDGGTKRRGADEFVKNHPAEELVYGGVAIYGKAQEALALCCKDHGKQLTLFVPKRNSLHPFTARAKQLGARIIEVANGMLTVTEARARQYAAECPSKRARFPIGVDHPDIVRAIGESAAAIDFSEFSIGEDGPTEVWSIVSGGVLSRGLQAAWPNAKIYGVTIGHRAPPEKVGRARLYSSKYKYFQREKHPPPWPALLEYDAKLWPFVERHASENAVIWNVA